jgi:hypothetical protein
MVRHRILYAVTTCERAVSGMPGQMISDWGCTESFSALEASVNSGYFALKL